MDHRLSHTSKSLRIAMLSIHSSPIGDLGTQNTGGMSVYILALARNLGYVGHHVDIYTCAPGEDPIRIIGPNVRLIHLFLPQVLSQGRVEKEHLSSQAEPIFQQMEQRRRELGINYDVIHSHYWISGLVGMLAREKWRCPHIIMFHTLGWLKNHMAWGENESEERITNERRLTRAAQCILVPTEQEKNHLMIHYQADPEKISVVPCGVDLGLFKPGGRSEARRRLGINESARLLLTVGRFAPLKGLDHLVEAVAELKPRYPDIELMIVGGDDSDAGITRALQDRIIHYHLTKNIRLAGRVEHKALPCYYAAADVMVLPSQYESFGLVVLEALACGLPVAATPVGAARMIIQRDRNGILFNSPETADIAAGLERMLAWMNTHSMSHKQVRASVMNFGWNRISGLVTRVYDLMLEDDGGHCIDISVICGNR